MDITQFDELWRAVNRIEIDQIARTEVALFEKEGLDTNLDDIYSDHKGELFTVLPDGTIRKTIVHICDISNYRAEWELPKFHIFECQTLLEMRRNKRKHRYKKASGSNGDFWIIKPEVSEYKELKICNRDCLHQYNTVYGEDMNVDNFDITNYIEKPMQHVQPYITQELDMTTVPQTYARDWLKISNERKKYHDGICQECFYDCSKPEMKQYLHTHHVDADPTNNTHENLKVLCIECHSNQYQHGHIKNSREYKAFIRIKENYAGQ